MSKEERTFIAVKPDGVQRGLIGEIIKRFENKGYKLVAMKLMTATLEQAQIHYEDLSSKKFYPDLCRFFSSGPICAMVWEGLGVVKGGRTLLGATNPADSLPGTIRGDFAVDLGRNVCHGSDGAESAKREISFWFKPEELTRWDSHSECQVYESQCGVGLTAAVTKDPHTGETVLEGGALVRSDRVGCVALMNLTRWRKWIARRCMR